MLEHEQQVAAWREQLRRQGVLQAWQLDELEDHLWIELERERGADASSAWQDALAALGDAATLIPHYDTHPTMKLTSRIAGVVLCTLFLGFAMNATAGWVRFIYVPSILLVLGLVLGGLWMDFGPRRVMAAFTASLGFGPLADQAESARHVEVLGRGSRLSWGAGVLGVIVGVIGILSDLSDPVQIGRGAATALLALFYGAILGELVFPSLRRWALERSLVLEPGIRVPAGDGE